MGVGESDVEARNTVELVGHLSAAPQTRTLPSGDELVTLRLVVDRPPGSRGPSVDTIDLACWSARTRAFASRYAVGDVLEVSGALRRRFFKTSGGPASRYEVEVSRVKRLRAG
ncbi:MAG: single-stranded DNA-binding protein [Micrococcales bacterium]|nr:single-stranded DNA-binding protein [Micrococcales bacterium]